VQGCFLDRLDGSERCLVGVPGLEDGHPSQGRIEAAQPEIEVDGRELQADDWAQRPHSFLQGLDRLFTMLASRRFQRSRPIQVVFGSGLTGRLQSGDGAAEVHGRGGRHPQRLKGAGPHPESDRVIRLLA
jgi:hypothetical protein